MAFCSIPASSTSSSYFTPPPRGSSKFPPDFVRRLEDRALDAAATTSAGEVSRLLSTLAEQGRRPPPLLRALCFHAARQPEPVAYKDAVRTLFALQKLNFPDQVGCWLCEEKHVGDLLYDYSYLKSPWHHSQRC